MKRQKHWFMVAGVMALAAGPFSRADIFEWEWIDPASTSFGTQPSTVVCPDGSGLTPGPGLVASGLDLRRAFLSRYDLTGANFSGTNLNGATLHSATLANADFTGVTISGAILTQTTVRGFTMAQLASTASYVSGELAGIDLGTNGLTGWDFAGKNLSGASFRSAVLTNADFAGADLSGAGFGEANLTNAKLTGANLSGAAFWLSTLSDADFTGAIIAGANFAWTTPKGFTRAQFESTASYASGDLAGTYLGSNDLAGWNLAGKDLRNAWLSMATLADADFSGANLAHIGFFESILTNANFTGADARGSVGMEQIDQAITRNFIQGDGRIKGLAIAAGESFRVWDYTGRDWDRDGVPDMPIRITIHGGMSIDPTGTLRIGLEDADWGSTITFMPGVPVVFGGTFEVFLAYGFTPTPGDAWQIFDLAGVSPVGHFDSYLLPGPGWDCSTLLTDGHLRYVPEPGSALLYLGGALLLGRRGRRWPAESGPTGFAKRGQSA